MLMWEFIVTATNYCTIKSPVFLCGKSRLQHQSVFLLFFSSVCLFCRFDTFSLDNEFLLDVYVEK